MPTFCRHNRLVERCPICSKQDRSSSPTRSAPRRPSKPAGAPTRAPRKSASGGMVTRRMQRAPDDGYEHDLVPGLRSSVDAARLADELALSDARLLALPNEPFFAELAAEPDRDRAARVAFLTAYLWPVDGAEDPFASIRAVAADPAALSSAQTGAMSSHDPAKGERVLDAFQHWADRSGGPHAALVGDEGWDPARRFDRAFERLGGVARPSRLEFLVIAARLQLAEMDINTMHLSAATPMDPVLLAAKRILGIGDIILLRRRANELAHAVGVPVAAMDLALFNWAAGPEEARTTGGLDVEADAEVRARIAGALGLAP
ncbi:MAG: hypothetical protein HZB46_07970 [Solirubrobacterales bacterium]|nr:hypothetical protein [Solirubrobacterales bacterium]